MQTVWKRRVTRELFRFFSYALFFTLFFFAFALYRQLILKEYGVSYIHYGYSLFEAFILAKLILLGQLLGLGERYAGRALIVPTLYKTVIFSFFVWCFTVLEHFFVGFLRGTGWSKLYQELLERGMDEILARILVMSFVFVLFFAFVELGRVMGEGKLLDLFFHKKKG